MESPIHKKKKSSRRKDTPTETTTGDLFGFDFGAGSQSVEAQGIASDIGAMTMRTTTAVAPASNPINSAFDDLLGINGSSIEWGYLNSGTHDAQRDNEFDRATVRRIVEATTALDAGLAQLQQGR